MSHAQHLNGWVSDKELNGKVAFLLVGINTSPDEGSKFCRNNSVASSIIHGTADRFGEKLLTAVYGVDSVPHQIIVDRDGVVVVNGFPVELSKVKELLKTHSSEVSAQISPQGMPSLSSPSQIVMHGEASIPNDMYSVEMILKTKKKIGRHSGHTSGSAVNSE